MGFCCGSQLGWILFQLVCSMVTRRRILRTRFWSQRIHWTWGPYGSSYGLWSELTRTKPTDSEKRQRSREGLTFTNQNWLVGATKTPLKNDGVKASWDDYSSQHMESHSKFHGSSHHQAEKCSSFGWLIRLELAQRGCSVHEFLDFQWHPDATKTYHLRGCFCGPWWF